MTKEAPILILHGSQQPFISIGRHYGGIRLYGHQYDYLPEHDAFLREDYVKGWKRRKKDGVTWEQFIELVKTIKQ